MYDTQEDDIWEDDDEVRHEIYHRVELNEEGNKILEKVLEEFEKDPLKQPLNLWGIDRRHNSGMEKLWHSPPTCYFQYWDTGTGKQCFKNYKKRGRWTSWVQRKTVNKKKQPYRKRKR